jgi:hypothetical protein
MYYATLAKIEPSSLVDMGGGGKLMDSASIKDYNNIL